MIELSVRRQQCRIDRRDTCAELTRRCDRIIDGLARIVVETIVVLVDAEIGSPRRLALIHVFEIRA